MKAQEIMSSQVVSVTPDATILHAARLMLQHRFSGLPVVDAGGKLLGIVSEGDFMRRTETGTVRRRPRWVEFLIGPGPLAERIASLGDRMLARPGVKRALSRPLRIELAIERFPVCWLELSAMGFVLMSGVAPGAQLHMQMPYKMLTLFAGGGWPGVAAATRALLGSRMHVTELLREAPRLAALATAVVRG